MLVVVSAAASNPPCTPTTTTVNTTTVVQTFSSPDGNSYACDWTFPSGITSINVLAVGGGGGGGRGQGAGGGGGGGVAYATNFSISSGATFAMNIGGGGSAGTSTVKGGYGGNTSLVRNSDTATVVIAGGGGGGGTFNYVSGSGPALGTIDGDPGKSVTTNVAGGAAVGGSGGGAAMSIAYSGVRVWGRGGQPGSGTTSNGFAGASSFRCDIGASSGTYDNYRAAGGGGGASAAGGGNPTPASGDPANNCTTYVPNGGAGATNSITGTSIMYGSGGGAADARASGTGASSDGAMINSSGRGIGGGSNSGQNGGAGQAYFTSAANTTNYSSNTASYPATKGIDGRGEGGGGGIDTSVSGGAGVIIISYSIAWSSTTPAANSTVNVDPTNQTAVTGISLNGAVDTATYLVSISSSSMPSGASLQLSNVTGATASYGITALSTSATFSSTNFTVTGANLNTVLGSLKFNPSTAASPTISISVTENQTGLAYNPTNQHFYQAVAGNVTATSARTSAGASTFGGLAGYVVTITNDAENDFVQSRIQNATNVWIGASDNTTEGHWIWDQGPENGTVFWDAGCYTSGVLCGGSNHLGGYDGTTPVNGTRYPGTWSSWSSTNHNKWCGVSDGAATNSSSVGTEPNNSYATNGHNGENYAVTNWNGGTNTYSVGTASSTTHSCWNDLNSDFGTDGGAIGGYVIEWGGNGTFNNTISRSFNLSNANLAQTITIASGPAENSTVSTQTTTFNATSSSGLILGYSSSDVSACTVASATAASGANLVVTLLRSYASCSITITQAGNSYYQPAPSVTRSFTSLYGPVTSCASVGSLTNGNFDSPLTGVTDSSSPTGNPPIAQWHGYNGGYGADPRQILFMYGQQSGSTPKVSGWKTSDSGGLVEIQRLVNGWSIGNHSPTTIDNSNIAPAGATGSYWAELNANSVGTLYQDVATLPGTTLRWSMYHRGRNTSGIDEMRVRIGPASASLTNFSDAATTTYDQSPTTRPPSSGTGAQMQDARGASSLLGGAGRSDKLTAGGSSGGWGYYEGSYTVPTGQTLTRFAFASISASHSATVGNELDEIQFSPLIACPATFTAVANRTVLVNPFDVNANGNFTTHDAEDSYGWSDATVDSTGLSVSSGGGSVARATADSVANRGISYTAPATPGTYTINFQIKNSAGDTSNSTYTVNVIKDVSGRAPSRLPIDPRATLLNIKNINIYDGPSRVLTCVNEADNSGAQTTGTLLFDVGNYGTTDSTLTSGSDTVTVTGDRSNALTLSGPIAAVNSILTTTRVTRTSGTQLSATLYALVRSVPGGLSVGVLTCSDAISTGTQLIKIDPVVLSGRRQVTVNIN